MQLAFVRSDTPGEMNATLRALADVLGADGIRIVGAVQSNRDDAVTGACAMELEILPGGPRICISQDLGPGATGCRLDTERLAQAVHECSQRLAAGADLLIVNKFGAHEAEGRGFRDLIGTASADGVPVVVGVSGEKLPAFEEFASGLAAPLPCSVSAVVDWARAAVASRAE